MGDDPTEQLLEHDGVGVQDRQQLSRVVAGNSVAVQLHQLVEGGPAQIRLQSQPQLLIDDVPDIDRDFFEQNQAHKKNGQRPEKLHGMDGPVLSAEKEGENIIVCRGIVLHDIIDEHGRDERQQEIRSQRHAAHGLCEDSSRRIFLPVPQPELKYIHSSVPVFFPARRHVASYAFNAVSCAASHKAIPVVFLSFRWFCLQ